MKLHSKAHAGQTLSTSKGNVKVDAEGHVETEDKDLSEQLLTVGFKHVFRKKPDEAEPAKAAPAEEPAADDHTKVAHKPSHNKSHDKAAHDKGHR